MIATGTGLLRLPRRRPSRRPPRRTEVVLVGLLVAGAGCGPREAPPELAADSVLRRELGLTELDRVHRVLLTAGDREEVRPDSVAVLPGDWVEFLSGDWRVREVRFDREELAPAARDFLAATDQMDSPPLVRRDARFVVSFSQAPPGRYPFRVEGNTAPASGVVVVVPSP